MNLNLEKLRIAMAKECLSVNDLVEIQYQKLLMVDKNQQLKLLE